MASIFWTLGASGNWNVAADWSTGTVPGEGDDAVLGVTGFAIVENYTVSVTTSIDVDSITISDTGAVLSIANPGAVSVATNVSNAGTVYVDTSGSGGSTLTIGGTLTNSNLVQIGDSNVASTVTAQGLDNTD